MLFFTDPIGHSHILLALKIRKYIIYFCAIALEVAANVLQCNSPGGPWRLQLMPNTNI